MRQVFVFLLLGLLTACDSTKNASKNEPIEISNTDTSIMNQKVRDKGVLEGEHQEGREGRHPECLPR